MSTDQEGEWWLESGQINPGSWRKAGLTPPESTGNSGIVYTGTGWERLGSKGNKD